MAPKPEENEALVRRFLTDVVGDGDLEGLKTLVAEDVAEHDLAFGSEPGYAEVDALGRGILAAADVDVEIEDLVAEGDRVAVRATVSGTTMGLPTVGTATGGRFDIAHVGFYRVEDGQIAEAWSLPDTLGLVRQLEVVPEALDSPDERNVSTNDRRRTTFDRR